MKFHLDRYRIFLLSVVGICAFISVSTGRIVDPPGVNRTYLVKLVENLPADGASILDEIVWKNDAVVDKMYEGHEDELGRWIIITSKNEISSELRDDRQEVEVVEDGSATYENPKEESFLYPKYIKRHETKDKTWGIRIPKVREGLEILKPYRIVTVAVVDTGCDLKHPALKDSLIPGHNFAGGDENDASNRSPKEMHATHVTGTIVAARDSNGFFGIANSVAKVMPVRVLNERGSGNRVDVCRGIVYAADHGANVINMSLGSTHYSKSLEDAVNYAQKKNVTVVCAKGNSNTDKPHYPSDLPGVIRVTATALRDDGTEERAYFSNYGINSSCSAPGHFTYSTLPGGKYGFASGTSMACPHTAACVAVILSQWDLAPDEVRAIIEKRGDELKTDKPIGLRINLYKFIQTTTHQMMLLDEKIRHPFGQCCIDAGIHSKRIVNIDACAGHTTVIDQDSNNYHYLRRYYDDQRGTISINRHGKRGPYIARYWYIGRDGHWHIGRRQLAAPMPIQ